MAFPCHIEPGLDSNQAPLIAASDSDDKTSRFKLIPGGCDTTLKAAEETDLMEQIQPKNEKYDYDILVKTIES